MAKKNWKASESARECISNERDNGVRGAIVDDPKCESYSMCGAHTVVSFAICTLAYGQGPKCALTRFGQRPI